MGITVNPINESPLAELDNYVVDGSGTLSVSYTTGVLANDTDPEHDPLTAVLVDDVSHGTLTLNLDGSFIYIHDGSKIYDSFTYTANDGEFDSSEVEVTLTIL